MKVIIKILVVLTVLLIAFQSISMAKGSIRYFITNNNETMVYKQINAAKITLSDKRILSDMLGNIKEDKINEQVEVPVEIYLVLDASGSMTSNNRLEQTRSATLNLIDKLSEKIKQLSIRISILFR